MKNKKSADWSSLDNAAKIFPCASDKRDTKVFRFICELNDDVDPVALQKALDVTLIEFPLYRAVLKRGAFWYYLEESEIPATVLPENRHPCRPRYEPNYSQLLFEVTYFHKRINLEIYHALTDGTGALYFFKTLICRYVALAHSIEYVPEGADISDASSSQKGDDSFQKYYSGKVQKSLIKDPRAFRLHGMKTSENRLKIIGGEMDTSGILALSRAHETTATIFLTAVLMCAIESTMQTREKGRPVVASVPVNLRNVFPSQSARNFFSVVNVSYDFRGGNDIADVIAAINEQMKSGMSKAELERRLNLLMALEKNKLMSIVPLFIKNPVMHYFHHKIDKHCTIIVSNLGKIQLPVQIREFVRIFEVFVSTDKLQLCTCSHEGRFCATFSSAFQNTDVQMEFFRLLAHLGLEITITANMPDE